MIEFYGMKCLRFFLLPFLLLSYFAKADNTMAFEGTIGTYPVLLSVTCSDGSCEGMYCYRKTRKDIRLEGKLLSATQARLNTPNNSETFTLALSPSGWTGKWITNKGKQLDVKLKPLNIAGVQHMYKDLPVVQKMRGENPYAYVRTADLALTKDSVTHQSGHSLQWYKIEKSGVYFCYVTDGYPDAVLKKANAILLNAAISAAEDFYECTSPYGEGEMDYNMTVSLLSPGIISMYSHEYYDCGGAHPDDGIQPLNIDARTGRLLTLDEILWFATGKMPAEDSDEWYKYRDSIFAPKVVELLHQYHAKEMDAKDPEAGEDCTYGNDEYKFPQFYFTKDGLYLSPSIPHVIAPCRDPEWSVLPFSEVKKHLRPGLNLDLP